MPVKIARSAPRPSFGLPELLVAIHTSRQSCSKAGKGRIFALVCESSGESRFRGALSNTTPVGQQHGQASRLFRPLSVRVRTIARREKKHPVVDRLLVRSIGRLNMQAALSLLARYQRKLQEKGLREIISGRWRWYKQSFQMDNWCIGRLVELCGNRVPFNGITLDLDNPLIPTPSKSTLLFGIYETAELDLTRRFIDRSIPTVELGGINRRHRLRDQPPLG